MTDTDKAGRICESLLQAAKDDRKTFDKEGDEVAKYAYGEDTAEADYKDFPGGEPAFKAKVAKMAQAVDIFGPYLYPANPTRKVTPRAEADPFTIQRLKRLEQFLNYTPTECDLYTESLFCTNQALVRGRGVMWTGLDKRRGLIRSVADSVSNLLKDPDAPTERDVNWKARKRHSPRWELAQRYKESGEAIWGLEADKPRKSEDKARSRDHSTEQVCYYDMYCRVGLHHYQQGFELIDRERAAGMADDSPRKYVVAGNKIIWSGPWDIPWFVDNDWPCTELDLRDCVNSLWPKSPLWPGMCHQRALNWVYGVYMTRMANSFRKIIGVLEGPDGPALSAEDLGRALEGDGDAGHVETVMIKWKGDQNVKLKDLIQELVFTAGADEFERFWAVVGREFEESTGLYQILHQGDVGRQMRSKAEVDLKQSSSRTRINYYKEREEKFQSKLARKEALAAMFAQPREVIAKIFGEEAAIEFGEILPPEMANAVDPMTGMKLNPFAIDFEKAFYEADYTIESGSMRPYTPEQAQDAAQEFMNQALPALTSVGMPGPALHGVLAWAEINRMPKPMIDSIKQAIAAVQMMPPAIPGAAAPAAQPVEEGAVA